MKKTRHINGARRAFSVLELLVVVAIIAVLVALVAGAGVAVLGDRKVDQAESLLSTLDRALSEYMTENADNPPPYIRDAYVNTPGTGYDVNGTRDNDLSNSAMWIDPDGDTFDDPRHPDAAVFIRQVRGIGAVDAILEGLGDQWLVATPQTGSTEINAADSTPSVLDPWADPNGWFAPWPILGIQTVYYVHPSNEAAQRLYGRCRNGRPYFMSAGPDGIFGSTTEFTSDGSRDAGAVDRAVAGLEDNVYSYEPDAPDLSDDFNSTWR
jgi:prepilin-type N-terminal cleavage/methylation domain-containing protein